MSYGMQIFNSDGSLAIGSLSEPPRLIYYEEFEYDFSGTRVIPEFDDTRGWIAVSFGYQKIGTGGAPVADSTNLSINGVRVEISLASLPTLSWTQSTTTLSITSPYPTYNSSVWPRPDSKFAIYMVHYK